METWRGSSPTKNTAGSDAPDQLLGAFKDAALSVTKLYKESTSAQAKARSSGYQDCIEDLRAFIDKRRIGLDDGEGLSIRRWIMERSDNREGIAQTIESDNEVERNETASSPEVQRAGSVSWDNGPASAKDDHPMRTDSAPPTTLQPSVPTVAEEPQIAVPTRDQFTFQSSHHYPQEALNIEGLDLSDSRPGNALQPPAPSAPPSHHTASRPRSSKAGPRPRTSNHLGRGAGQKRTLNFAEIFDLQSIGYSKDMFGRGSKRSRHT